MAISITTSLKVANLTALAALTNTTDGIVDGSFRYVDTTLHGAAWYRYEVDASFQSDGINYVTGEAGMWVRSGNKVQIDNVAPTNAPNAITDFYYSESGGLLIARGTASVNDWQHVGGAGQPQEVQFSTASIAPDTPTDVDVTLNRLPFILVRVSTNIAARVNLFHSSVDRTNLKNQQFGLLGLNDINRDGVQFDYQNDSAAIDWWGSVACHGLKEDTDSLKFAITNKTGSAAIVTTTLRFYRV